MKAIKNNSTIAKLLVQYGVYLTQIKSWKTELERHSETIFINSKRKIEKSEKKRLAILERKIGQLIIENDFLKKI